MRLCSCVTLASLSLLLACEDGPVGGESDTGDGALVELDAGDGSLPELDAEALDGASAQGDADATRVVDAAPMVQCTAVAPTACPSPAPSYADVAPIIERRCASCHSPHWTGPWPLDTYGHVADWQDTIRSMLLTCSMPPADAGGPLPDDESALILGFIRCGLPK